MDRFFVYEVPIPDAFTNTKGNRQIRVNLAFDIPGQPIWALQCHSVSFEAKLSTT